MRAGLPPLFWVGVVCIASYLMIVLSLRLLHAGVFAADEAYRANHPTTVLSPAADEMQAVMMSLEFKNGSRYLSTKQLDDMVASGVVETAIASVLEEEVSWSILET